jgi:hypothetical protein
VLLSSDFLGYIDTHALGHRKKYRFAIT